MNTAEGESLAGEMRSPSVPIFKSSLQVILFFLDASHSHIFCLFVLHERAHSLSPSQIYHFPLLSLNSSYSNGRPPCFCLSRAWVREAWSGWPRTITQALHPGCLHLSHMITSAGNTKGQIPISNPRTPDSFSDLAQMPMGPSVPWCLLKQQLV